MSLPNDEGIGARDSNPPRTHTNRQADSASDDSNGKAPNLLADRACYCRGGLSCVTCGAWRRLFRDLQVRCDARRSAT